MPFWYFSKLNNFRMKHIECIDPQGVLAKTLSDVSLGCVMYCCLQQEDTPQGGISVKGAILQYFLGEIYDRPSERLTNLIDLLTMCGFPGVTESLTIRKDLWRKLIGNISINTVSALTGSTCGELSDPGTPAYKVCFAMMTEAMNVAHSLGVVLDIDIKLRLEQVGLLDPNFKTSMLQDVEADRRLEIDPICTSVIEVARLVNVPTPTIDIVHPLLCTKDLSIKNKRKSAAR
eukprot:GHVL01024574.1.p1 GENE.GHVL01024574.1~~GHVL01024574.1.p1  ORF type:complete len:232 (+),score=34.40 GHVL01024574.1:496-1191(+)